MEILAPAGAWESMVACIEAGADSVYGGLDRWNARHRAENFTLDGLRRAVAWCHDRGRQFYLTLNTLVRDDELNEISDLFGDPVFSAVDAVIIADMGLIAACRQRLPNVAIHASTQFGAHSRADLDWLREYGVERVILPREASIEEICRLAGTAAIDVEVFAWGSRCVCFSGDCSLSSLLAGGSGDRGRCIGVCRDMYEHASGTGQLLYPEDLDIGWLARTLADVGVKAIKVEGRRRPPDELAEVVRRYRRILDSPARDHGAGGDARCLGWITGRLDLAHHVRAGRNDPSGERREKWYAGKTPKAVAEPSVLVKACRAGDRFLDIMLSSRADGNWDVRATTNEGDVFTAKVPCGREPASPDSVFGLDAMDRWRCREIRIDKPDGTGLSSRGIADALAALPTGDDIDPLPHPLLPPDARGPVLRVEVCTVEQALVALDHGADGVIARVRVISDIAKFEASIPHDMLTVKLPMFDWGSQGCDSFLSATGSARILATRWNQLSELSRRGLQFGCDASMHIWNAKALGLAQQQGACYITSPLDWSLAEACRFAGSHGVNTDAVLAGRTTLGWARLHWCSSPCSSESGCGFDLTDLDLGTELRVYCNGTGMSELAAAGPLPVIGSPHDCGASVTFRYVAAHDSQAEIGETLGILKSRRLPMEQWASEMLEAARPQHRLLRSAR